MEYVQDLFVSGDFPVFTAFLLGLLLALHPCPMAAGMAALGYMARGATSRGRVFLGGLLYAAGHILAYTLLGAVLIAVIRSGRDILHVGDSFGEWGERALVVILAGVGLWMLFSSRFHHHEHTSPVSAIAGRLGGPGGSFLLGVLFALAFCPESAVVYFGMLIPMSAGSSAGYLLPRGYNPSGGGRGLYVRLRCHGDARPACPHQCRAEMDECRCRPYIYSSRHLLHAVLT